MLEMIFFRPHLYETRQVRQYRLPFNRLDVTNQYFLNDALELWSLIQTDLREAGSMKLFKKTVQKFI